jgi:hypothetical protein
VIAGLLPAAASTLIGMPTKVRGLPDVVVKVVGC